MKKVKNKDNDPRIIGLLSDDPEVQSIRDKYSEKTLNPFKKKKNEKLMKEEIEALIKAREEAEKERQKRLLEERKAEEKRIREEKRREKVECFKESFGLFISKNKTILTISLVVFMVCGAARIGIDKYKSIVQNVSFTFSDEEKYVGDYLDLSFVVEPDTAKYSDDDFDILFNDSNLVKGSKESVNCVKEGTLIVKLYYKDKEIDSKTITIKPVLINKLFIQDFEIGKGNSLELKPVIEPENATNKSYSMSVEDTDIASIKDNTITGLELGNTILHLRSVDGFSYDVKVSVIDIPAESIELSGIKNSYITGEKAKPVVKLYPSETTLKGYELISSNTKVANFDDEGFLIALDKGKTEITAYYNDEIKDAITVSVDYPAPTGVTISSSTTSLNAGSSLRLSATVEPDPVSDDAVKWTSSNENVATVDENGKVRGIEEGNVTIYAKTVNGKSDSILLTVNKVTVSLAGSGSSGSSSGTRNNFSGGSTYVLNTNTSVFHYPSCRDVAKIKSCNRQDTDASREEIISWGYKPCGHCHP